MDTNAARTVLRVVLGLTAAWGGLVAVTVPFHEPLTEIVKLTDCIAVWGGFVGMAAALAGLAATLRR